MFTRIARASADAPSPIVSTAEIKTHLFISHSDEDAFLEGLAATATAFIDGPNGIGVAVEPTIYVATLERIPLCLALPISPVISIVSVTVGGVPMSSLSYRLVTGRTPAVVYFSEVATSSRRDDFELTFEAGYIDVPADLKHAALLLIGNWYRNREAASDVKLNDIPLGVEALLSRYRAPIA